MDEAGGHRSGCNRVPYIRVRGQVCLFVEVRRRIRYQLHRFSLPGRPGRLPDTGMLIRSRTIGCRIRRQGGVVALARGARAAGVRPADSAAARLRVPNPSSHYRGFRPGRRKRNLPVRFPSDSVMLRLLDWCVPAYAKAGQGERFRMFGPRIRRVSARVWDALPGLLLVPLSLLTVVWLSPDVPYPLQDSAWVLALNQAVAARLA